ncbi:non-specific serine/threonine protein kinase [Entamoeba marina]
MKVIKISAIIDEKTVKMIRNEVLCLKDIQHQNIVKLYGVFQTNNFMYLIMDYVAEGELKNAINNKELSENDCKIIIRQVLDALYCLKQHRIIHRDLKPENILFRNKQDKTIVLTDFNLSRFLDDGNNTLATTICGSPMYVAPEVINNKKGYDAQKVDVWSCGVLLYYMVCGYSPFVEFKGDYLQSISEGRYRFGDDWYYRNPLLKDLVEHMLVKNIEERYSIEECIRHPLFRND